MNERPIEVLLVDDHAVVRSGFRRLLEMSGGIEVVAEAETAEQGCRLYADCRCDVVVMDLSLPGMGGLEAVVRLVRRDPQVKVLVFSIFDEAVFARRALDNGARGYITKRSAPDVMVEAVRRVASGETFIGPDLAPSLRRRDGGSLESLSPRELEILRQIAEGRTLSHIADTMALGYKTVANYSTAIRSKLNVTTTAELTRLAIRCRVVSM